MYLCAFLATANFSTLPKTEMTSKIKICDWSLLIFTVLMLASALQLEITSGADKTMVWLHIVLGSVFMANICWHLQLHYKWRNWLKALWKRTPVIKWLTATSILTSVTGVWAIGEWVSTMTHSPVGAVHGKIGFLMVVFVFVHTFQKIKFYR